MTLTKGYGYGAITKKNPVRPPNSKWPQIILKEGKPNVGVINLFNVTTRNIIQC